MTDDLELMQLHLAALFTHDERGRLRTVNERDGAPAPRFFFGRTAAGNSWRYRHGLPDDVADRLDARCAAEPLTSALNEPFRAGAYFTARLDASGAAPTTWDGPAFRFPASLPAPSGPGRVSSATAELLQPEFADWVADIPECQPFVVSVEDGRAVSICCSVRITDRAHEAGVETAPDYRRRGHATRVVAAWAEAVRGLGRIPLYSTSWENTASRGVASRLGLVQYGADFHVT